ncbi:BofC C-terminal domain-containing protein [Paenibacillus popilliae]|uniref:Bypass of forespore C C-terminal domain-containing protein n=1 Tax=Paenibacillus popilliae ATCC 14706 TaxID=1212764 RepID=M9LLD6_PAEPP|nr:BofC C-terminal domain-containing protein [Paenibacillus popilliae]GAC40926.1 hypothetical protein PPOP_0266 [Paenibacillus popilliae ATCC 14706]
MTREHRSRSRFYFRVKQWKQDIRRTKGPIWRLVAIVLFFGALTLAIRMSMEIRQLIYERKTPISMETFAMIQEDKFAKLHDSSRLVLNQLLQQDDRKREVIHRQQFICGQREETMGMYPSAAIIQLILNHPDWGATLDVAGRIIMEEQIEEMSDRCKDVRISLDEDGNLTLYEGPPAQKKVIRTFFQIDVESMESALPPHVLQQLYDGILITDTDEYHSVLSTFSDYAVEASQKVMNPAAEAK